MGATCGKSAMAHEATASPSHRSASPPSHDNMSPPNGLLPPPMLGAMTSFNSTSSLVSTSELRDAVKGDDFSFDGRNVLAKIVSYYDGDTVRIKFKFDDKLIQYPTRLTGYDCPEMRPKKSNPHRDAEKLAAKAAKQALINKIDGKLVIVQCGPFDKYGRILATIFSRNGENINKWMIREGYGIPYDGGHKITFEDIILEIEQGHSADKADRLEHAGNDQARSIAYKEWLQQRHNSGD